MRDTILVYKRGEFELVNMKKAFREQAASQLSIEPGFGKVEKSSNCRFFRRITATALSFNPSFY